MTTRPRWFLIPIQPRLALSPFWTSVLAAAALTSAISRGLDYIAIGNAAPASLSVVERAMPLDYWGAILVLGAAVAIGSWIASRWVGVILAHVLLSGTYIAFGVGSLWAVLGDNWVGSGWRSGVVGFILVQGVLHFVLAVAAVREWDRVRAKNG